MIPRFSPTFSLEHIRRALKPEPFGLVEAALCRKVGQLHGFENAYLTATARDGLRLILSALGGTGDVLIPAYNCLAVPQAIIAAGWRPVFADVGPDGVNMSLETLRTALTPGTRVVIPTHQFGLPCDIRRITTFCRERNLFVIEDAAAALGATVDGKPVGSFGDASIVSFHLTKVISAVQGGCVLVRDEKIASCIEKTLHAAAIPGGWDQIGKALLWRMLTSQWVYGAAARVRSKLQGEDLFQKLPASFNALSDSALRCPSFCARLALAQFDQLSENAKRRDQLGRFYASGLSKLKGVSFPSSAAGSLCSFVQFPVFVSDKSQTYYSMLRRGVDVSWNFRYCCSESFDQNMAQSIHSAKHMIGLPTFPSLTDSQAQEVVDALREILSEAGQR